MHTCGFENRRDLRLGAPPRDLHGSWGGAWTVRAALWYICRARRGLRETRRRLQTAVEERVGAMRSSVRFPTDSLLGGRNRCSSSMISALVKLWSLRSLS